MLQLLFDSSGIVHLELVPQGATVNEHLYKYILRRLREAVVSALNFGAAPIGYYLKTMALHICLYLSKRNWQDNRSTFCHTLQSVEEIITVSREAVQDILQISFRGLPAAIPMLADMHNGEYFERGCGSV